MAKDMKIRDIVGCFPELWFFDYKWEDSEEFKTLEEVLESLGYQICDPGYIPREYNDLKAYFEVQIKEA